MAKTSGVLLATQSEEIQSAHGMVHGCLALCCNRAKCTHELMNDHHHQWLLYDESTTDWLKHMLRTAPCHVDEIALVVLWQRRDGTTAVESPLRLPIPEFRAKLRSAGVNLEIPR